MFKSTANAPPLAWYIASWLPSRISSPLPQLLVLVLLPVFLQMIRVHHLPLLLESVESMALQPHLSLPRTLQECKCTSICCEFHVTNFFSVLLLAHRHQWLLDPMQCRTRLRTYLCDTNFAYKLILSHFLRPTWPANVPVPAAAPAAATTSNTLVNPSSPL